MERTDRTAKPKKKGVIKKRNAGFIFGLAHYAETGKKQGKNGRSSMIRAGSW